MEQDAHGMSFPRAGGLGKCLSWALSGRSRQWSNNKEGWQGCLELGGGSLSRLPVISV